MKLCTLILGGISSKIRFILFDLKKRVMLNSDNRYTQAEPRAIANNLITIYLIRVEVCMFVTLSSSTGYRKFNEIWYGVS